MPFVTSRVLAPNSHGLQPNSDGTVNLWMMKPASIQIGDGRPDMRNIDVSYGIIVLSNMRSGSNVWSRFLNLSPLKKKQKHLFIVFMCN